MVSELSDEKSMNSGSNELKVLPLPVVKRRNWLKQSMVSERKYSESNLGSSLRMKPREKMVTRKESHNSDRESSAESQTFMDDNKIAKQEVPQLPEHHPAEEDSETYYMKKVRILETKFKQMNLLYQNQILQLKKTNKELEEKLEIYKYHVLEYLPTV